MTISCRIIPQAVSVRYGLAIGARCAPFVLGLMYLFGKYNINVFLRNNNFGWQIAPVAYPTAKLLDYVLGQNEGHTYKKAELKSFLQFHRTGEEPLRDEEISILNGVLELNTKNVETIMTPIKVHVSSVRDKMVLLTCFETVGRCNIELRRHSRSRDCRCNVRIMAQFCIVSLTNSSSSLTSGYSRFPVHEPGNPLAFQGLLLIKKAILMLYISPPRR